MYISFNMCIIYTLFLIGVKKEFLGKKVFDRKLIFVSTWRISYALSDFQTRDKELQIFMKNCYISENFISTLVYMSCIKLIYISP